MAIGASAAYLHAGLDQALDAVNNELAAQILMLFLLLDFFGGPI